MLGFITERAADRILAEGGYLERRSYGHFAIRGAVGR
jgi:hypothetical protein